MITVTQGVVRGGKVEGTLVIHIFFVNEINGLQPCCRGGVDKRANEKLVCLTLNTHVLPNFQAKLCESRHAEAK